MGWGTSILLQTLPIIYIYFNLSHILLNEDYYPELFNFAMILSEQLSVRVNVYSLNLMLLYLITSRKLLTTLNSE